jgi:DNA mismatch endonuclease (patch repair protein)
MPLPGRRVYAYLRWSADGRTNERYVGEVTGASRAACLRDAWQQVLRRQLLPKTAADVASPHSAKQAARRAGRPSPVRDVPASRELRSRLHCAGLRFRIGIPPVPGMPRADIVFPREKVAVLIADDPVTSKQSTNTTLLDAGWQCLRFTGGDDLAEASRQIAQIIRSR